MRIINRLDEMTETARGWLAGGSVGFVPLRSTLHAGHLRLIQQARQDCQISVVSIVENSLPYPLDQASFASSSWTQSQRDLSLELRQLSSEGVDVVFVPHLKDLFPSEFSTFVIPTGPVVERLAGFYAPGYLHAVATLLTKLFQLVRPDIAYFGHKHAQEVALIQRLVSDLNIDVTLRILPTLRESDGVAISNRNSELSSKERRAARVLYRALLLSKALIENGERVPSVIEKAMANLVAKESLAKLEYASVSYTDTFEEVTQVVPGTLFAIVAQIGSVRLIDTILWMRDGTWLT